LPTSPNPVPEPSPHTSAARTFYLSKRLKDPQTQDAYTSALAKNVTNTNLGARQADCLQPHIPTCSQPESIRMFHFFSPKTRREILSAFYVLFSIKQNKYGSGMTHPF